MNVLKTAITSLVICALNAMALTADASQWGYNAQPPTPPNISRSRTLTNPTVAQIQSAIAPNTRINIIGTVNATAGDVIWVEANDVRLNFDRANVVNWRGENTWYGFVNISGQRVQVNRLRLQVDAGPGRCRGAMVFTPASDVRIANCQFWDVADGFVADGEWERLTILNTQFMNCGDWINPQPDGPREGGYGIFLEDDDTAVDHLRLLNVTVTLRADAGQHGVRISKVQTALIDNCSIGANEKRSLWAYGVNKFAVRNSDFIDGSVLFNLMSHEHYTDRETAHVRMENCRIDHSTILQPIGVYCAKGMRDFRVRDLEINSPSSPDAWMSIGWRTDAQTKNIRWVNGTVRFNGQLMSGNQGVSISDFTPQESGALNIKAIGDNR